MTSLARRVSSAAGIEGVTMRRGLGLLVLLGAGSVYVALAMTLVLRNPDVRVDTASGTSRTKLSDVVVNGQRVGVAWLDRRNVPEWSARFNLSNNHGATFLPNDIRLNTNFVSGDSAGSMGKIIVDSTGDNYFFIVMVTDDSSDHDAYATVSSDGGNTWAATQERILSLAYVSEFDQQLDVAPAGKAYVVWADGREGTGLPNSPKKSVWMRKTLNGGATWDAEQRINDPDLDATLNPDPDNEQSEQPSVCADGAGSVYVAWRDQRDPADPSSDTSLPGRIVLRASSDDGATFGGEIRLDVSDTGPGTPSREPTIGCRDDGLAAVVWEDDADGSGDFDVYLNFSTDSGATWQPSTVRVDSGGAVGSAASNPQIGIGNGSPATMHVAWEDDRDGTGSRDVYLSTSTDGGATWGAAQRMNSGTVAGTFPVESWDLSVEGDLVVVAWADSRDGSSDVYANHSEDAGQTFSGDTRLDLGTLPAAFDSIEVAVAAGSAGYVATFSDFRNSSTRADIFAGGESVPDADIDGVTDSEDNCPNTSNANQDDRDFDGPGDACDMYPDDPLDDVDADGTAADADNCPDVPNASQVNSDTDAFGDDCDLCDLTDEIVQRDLDGDGQGDACDNDVDGDGTDNAADTDDDDDGVPDTSDVCDFVPDPKQEDEDADGTGDACDENDNIVQGLRLSEITANHRIDWDPEDGAQSYDVFFGRAEDLASAHPGFCYRSDLIIEFTTSPELPRLGKIFWYLATSYDGSADGSAGLREGVPRVVPSPCTIAEAKDWDADGLRNFLDNCPMDANASQADSDADTVGDACDGCPMDDEKSDPGICGCGFDDDDIDIDGIADCIDPCTDTDGDGFGNPGFPANTCPLDGCPTDGTKSSPGVCGCGFPDSDADLDGSEDCVDDCTDTDGDGFGNPEFINLCQDDNCPDDLNPDQGDMDNNLIGDVCDVDTDGDGTLNTTDTDDDNDGVPDVTDVCDTTPDVGQVDHDGDGTGNACDWDDQEIWGVTIVPGAPDRMAWYFEPGASGYFVYSDSVSTIMVGQPYGACLVNDTPDLFADLPGDPGLGDARFYLVTGKFSAVEGPAGKDSAGNVRLVPGCP